MKASPFRLALPLLTLCLLNAPAFAHTTLETSTLPEGTRVLNNLQIGHACGAGTHVYGTSVVFPDGIDSSLLVDGAPYTGTLGDFVTNWGPNIQPLFNRAVFNTVDEKNGPLGNVVGFWAGGGAGMPDHMVGYIPFRVNATNINPQSCATSVRFHVNVVDICAITDASGLHNTGIAEFWTHNDLGTPYDRQSTLDDGPARLTITRNTNTNPLPNSCAAGTTVDVKVSKAQLERDMPIRHMGVQVWPK